MSRMESILMGVGGAAGIFPGISSMGAMLSVASVCGAERTYALNLSLMMNMAINAFLAFHDILRMTAGLGGLTFGALFGYLISAVAAFGAVYAGVGFMRHLAANRGYAVFAWYSLAMALLMFIIYLMV